MKTQISMQPRAKKFIVKIELDLEKVRDIEWALKQAAQGIMSGKQEFSKAIGNSIFSVKCDFEPASDYIEKKIDGEWYRVYPSAMNKKLPK